VIDEFNANRTGWARFSMDRRMRYRLARSLTDAPIVVRDSMVECTRGVTFLMLNPSTADAFQLDPTVRRCFGFAREWGADVLQVVNIFALRATDPRDLYEPDADIGDDHLNDGEILAACIGDGVVRVVGAWGAHGALRDRGRRVLRRLARFSVQLEHLGLTKDGHPKHPLYLKATTRPEIWP
jgi:hypothetical protein